MSTVINVRSLMIEHKLVGTNFLDWLRNLRIVLRTKKLGYVLEIPIPDEPTEFSTEEEVEAYNKHFNANEQVCGLMLSSMNLELQKQHEHMDALTMIIHLKELFAEHARDERSEVSRLLFNSKLQEDASAVIYSLKILGYIERLDTLGFSMKEELSIDLILHSLPSSYSQFVMNYKMNKIEGTVPELINLSRQFEPSLKKEKNDILLISSRKST